MKKTLSKVRDITEKVLDFGAYTIEIGITALDAKPGEISSMIEDRIQKLLGTDKKNKKPKTKRRNTPNKVQIHKKLGEEHDAQVEIATLLEARLAKDERHTNQRAIKRLLELKRIRDTKVRDLGFER